MPLSLSCACPPYDRVIHLALNQIVPEGLSLNFMILPIEEIFWRQARHAEFDISESSLSTYVMLCSQGDDRFIAIPVFTSRFFRHSCVFINKHKGIHGPSDLRGKIVGLPEYQITAVVWLRGIFQDEYGIYPRDIQWRTGGEETPGRIEKVKFDVSPEISLEAIPEGKTLARMLDEGEIDALFTARIPSTYWPDSPNVGRLFSNYRETEEAYFKKTGIFPIMHTVIIKQEVYKKNPWIARNLYKAFCLSKDKVMALYHETGALHAALPWLVAEVERTEEIMGKDWWPYGLEPNRRTLEIFLRYHHEQGLSKRLMSVKELFAPETLDEEYKI